MSKAFKRSWSFTNERSRLSFIVGTNVEFGCGRRRPRCHIELKTAGFEIWLSEMYEPVNVESTPEDLGGEVLMVSALRSPNLGPNSHHPAPKAPNAGFKCIFSAIGTPGHRR
jgi:hypothetical protein